MREASLRKFFNDKVDEVIRVDSGFISVCFADPTGNIELNFEKEDFPPKEWDVIRKLKVGRRLAVKGKTTHSTAGDIVVSVESVKEYPEPGTHERLLSYAADMKDMSERFHLSIVRNRASEYFRKKGYEEFESRTITMKKLLEHLQPLAVEFPGFGSTAWLSISPLPQVRDTLLGGGANRLFSINRCYSAVPRDGYTTAESLIVCAGAERLTYEQLLQEAFCAIKYIFSDMLYSPPTGKAWLNSLEEWNRIKNSKNVLSRLVEKPTIVVTDEDKAKENRRPFHMLWPQTSCIAEGYHEILGEELPLGFLTLHLERIMRVLCDNLREILPYE